MRPPPVRQGFRPVGEGRLMLIRAKSGDILVSSSADWGLGNPITGIAGCCALAASGHAAALPSPAMNSRRRIRDLPRWIRGAYRGAIAMSRPAIGQALALGPFLPVRPRVGVGGPAARTNHNAGPVRSPGDGRRPRNFGDSVTPLIGH